MPFCRIFPNLLTKIMDLWISVSCWFFAKTYWEMEAFLPKIKAIFYVLKQTSFAELSITLAPNRSIIFQLCLLKKQWFEPGFLSLNVNPQTIVLTICFDENRSSAIWFRPSLPRNARWRSCVVNVRSFLLVFKHPARKCQRVSHQITIVHK